jgi:hypothetical protein
LAEERLSEQLVSERVAIGIETREGYGQLRILGDAEGLAKGDGRQIGDSEKCRFEKPRARERIVNRLDAPPIAAARGGW